jgi:hypothetical protein
MTLLEVFVFVGGYFFYAPAMQTRMFKKGESYERQNFCSIAEDWSKLHAPNRNSSSSWFATRNRLIIHK